MESACTGANFLCLLAVHARFLSFLILLILVMIGIRLNRFLDPVFDDIRLA